MATLFLNDSRYSLDQLGLENAQEYLNLKTTKQYNYMLVYRLPLPTSSALVL